MTSPSTSLARTLRRWAFVAVPAAGVLELGLHLFFASRPPTPAQWDSLRGVVKAEKRGGELLVIAPHWADPEARRAFGDELLPMRDEGRPDESRYASALEVSVLDEHAPELSGFREVSTRNVGNFLLRHLENPKPAKVLYDFVDNARPPLVDVRGTEPQMACPFNPHAVVQAGGLGGHPTFARERFECPAGVFFNVGETIIADENFRPRRCLWAHPLARGELVVRYHNVPLGSVIHGHGGMYWIIERELRGAPVLLTIRVDGDTIDRVTHVDGDGWKAFELPLGSHANKPAAEVEFAVSSPNHRDRHFCFEADTR